MRKVKSILALSAIGLMTLTSCGKGDSSQTPMYDQYDKIVYGNIFVGENSNKTVEAVVIKDGRIEYAGNKEGAKKYESRTVEITTLKDGEFAMPGIVDSHTHPAVAWDEKSNSVMLSETDTLSIYLSKITDYYNEHKTYPVIRGKGFIESKFEKQEDKNNPKALLDAICDTIPIVVTDAGGHCIWANSKAIDMVCEKNPNIKKVDPDHPGHDNSSVSGGTIERNADGEAIGLFRDKCISTVNNACVKFTKEGYVNAITNAQKEYSSLGYTSYVESMVNESADITQTPKVEAYKELEEKGLLTTYVAGTFIIGNRDDYSQLVDKAISLRDETKGGNFEVTGLKIFMDGVVEGGSAYLKDPYIKNIDGSPAGDYRGSPVWANNLDRLTEVVVKANNAGMACHFHAIGDQASLDAMQCIEKAAERIGIDKVKSARNVMTHLQIVDSTIYSKFAKYNVIANLNPWANKCPGFYNETEVKLLGEKRASEEYPYKTFFDNGINCSFGTDFGSSFTYRLNESFLIFTTRKYYDSEKQMVLQETELNGKEDLTPSQTLSMMTAGGAYQFHRENEFGKIEVGKYANMLVVNKDLLTVAEDEIMSVEPQKTMFKGNWVYAK